MLDSILNVIAVLSGVLGSAFGFMIMALAVLMLAVPYVLLVRRRRPPISRDPFAPLDDPRY